MIRVATFATHQLSLSQQMRTQADWEMTNIQASSGQQSRDYAGIAIDSRRLISLENVLATTDSYNANIDITEHRLQGMETNVSALFDIVSEFRTLLVEALNANNAESAAINQNAGVMLDEAVGLLNLKQDDRYLFAGSATDTAPVDIATFDPDDAAYDPNDPILANMGYYAGNDTELSVRIDENMVLDYGVTAKESGFELLLRSLYLAQTANTAPGAVDKARLEAALDLANQAIEEVPNIQTRIGTTRARLEDTKATHVEMQLFAEQEISDIENVDVVRTMTQISALQLQLEASYMVTAQMASVTLMNFLR